MTELRTSETDLSPCPFCGSAAMVNMIPAHEHHIAKFMPAVGDTWILECSSCPAGFCGETREEVAAQWNRRVTPERIVYFPCTQHMGLPFTMTVGFAPPTRSVCPICEPPK